MLWEGIYDQIRHSSSPSGLVEDYEESVTQAKPLEMELGGLDHAVDRSEADVSQCGVSGRRTRGCWGQGSRRVVSAGTDRGMLVGF